MAVSYYRGLPPFIRGAVYKVIKKCLKKQTVLRQAAAATCGNSGFRGQHERAGRGGPCPKKRKGTMS